VATYAKGGEGKVGRLNGQTPQLRFDQDGRWQMKDQLGGKRWEIRGGTQLLYSVTMRTLLQETGKKERDKSRKKRRALQR